MKIKNKLRLGFGFLFLAVLLFGAASVYYIRQIASSANGILNNNYETLSFTKAMRIILDGNALPLNSIAIADFNTQLIRQEHNITEKGEAESTRKLRLSFNRLTAVQVEKVAGQQAEHQLQLQLDTIETLNIQSISAKNKHAQAEVTHATMLLSFVGAFTFLVLFSFSISFPDFVAGPMKDLLEGIHEIGRKNYSQRLTFNKNDELGEVASAFNVMAARLNEWENSNLATVLSEKRRTETVIEQMKDAIIVISEKQELLFINNAARSLLNLVNVKAVGQRVDALITNHHLLEEILSGRLELQPFKVLVNGKENYLQLERREIVVPNLSHEEQDTIRTAKKSAGVVYVLKNVTEFKERDVAKTNFIATISHELKTPISSIKLSLKLLDDERVGLLNEEQQELLGHIQEDNNRLLKITSELLNLSQVETGNIQLNFVPVKPVSIVDYALRSVQFQAEQKGVQLNFNRNAQLPEVHADVEKTAWVLVNLLSNALRYSPENSRVVIQTLARNNSIVFSISDSGKGIDEQYQKQLFDRYFQVPADTLNKSGSGLGLAICRDFIEAQNGKIWVESTVGKGSTFSFSLPVI